MVQLIGLLLCVYVFIRGLDIRSQIDERKPGRSQTEAKWASIIAIIGLLLLAQGGATPNVQ